MTYIKARPTIYNGIQMRSRLEGAFAEYADSRNWLWDYETNAYGSSQGQYLPDFVIRSRRTGAPLWYVEVKPTNADFDDALARMHVIVASDPDASLYVMTSDDYKRFGYVRHCSTVEPCGSCDRPKWRALHDLAHSAPTSAEMHAICGSCNALQTRLIEINTGRPGACGNSRCEQLAVELVFECESSCGYLTIWNVHTHKGDTVASYKVSRQTRESTATTKN